MSESLYGQNKAEIKAVYGQYHKKRMQHSAWHGEEHSVTARVNMGTIITQKASYLH